MYTFKINKKKHLSFIKLSNDKNLIHQLGNNSSKLNLEGTIIHGMNLVLKTLEILSKKKKIKCKKIISIECKFKSIVYINEKCKIILKKISFSKNLILIKTNQVEVLEIIISFAYLENLKLDNILFNKSVFLKKPIKNNPYKKNKKIIKFNHTCSKLMMKNNFPSLFKNFGSNRLSSLIMISASVGMYWPGQNSLFTGFKININNALEKKIYLEIIKVDHRILFTQTKFISCGCEGYIESFFRSEKINQPSIKKLKNYVSKNQFINHNSLIIGGSRGLGELTAKIILIGGGKVLITFNKNMKIAKKLKKELLKSKLNLKIKQFSVKKNGAFNNNFFKNKKYNSIYFFATPLIYRKKQKIFDNKIYKEFLNVYSAPLKKIIKINKNNKFVFIYPSTTFISEKNPILKEYVKAKINGENKLKKLNKKFNFDLIINRLPRLLTDQNNSIFEGNLQPGTHYILNIVKKVNNKLI